MTLLVSHQKGNFAYKQSALEIFQGQPASACKPKK